MNQFREYLPSELINVDSSAQLQAMIDYAFAHDITKLQLEPRRWRIDNTIQFPAVSASEVRQFELNCEGSIFDIQNMAADSALFDRRISDINDADTRFWVPTIRGPMTVIGSGTQHFFRWWKARGIHVADVKLSNLDIGVEVCFGLHSLIENCHATNVSRPFRAIGGDGETGLRFTGATNSNSNSNKTSFVNCSANMNDVAGVGFYLSQVGHGLLDQCTVEGPLADVLVDISGNTSTGFNVNRGVRIRSMWFECASYNTGIRFDTDKTVHTLEDLQLQSLARTGLNPTGALIDVKTSRRSVFNIRDTSWHNFVGTPGRFFSDSQVSPAFLNFWTFRDNLLQDPQILTSTDKWVGDTLPLRAPIEENTSEY